MAQPPDHPLFAFSLPFTGSATQVNALISRGLQAVSELPAGACAAQSMASSAFAAEVMATRETAGARPLGKRRHIESWHGRALDRPCAGDYRDYAANGGRDNGAGAGSAAGSRRGRRSVAGDGQEKKRPII